LLVAIRADGGDSIGMGHIARCNSIAEALKERGHEVAWISSSPERVRSVTGRYPETVTPPLAGDSLGRDDAAPLAKLPRPPTWIIIDHIAADENYLAIVRDLLPHSRILLLEDKDRREGSDLRLAPFQEAERSTDLCGPSYFPLDPVFAEKQSKERIGLIICLGGSATDVMISRMISEIEKFGTDEQITVMGLPSPPIGTDKVRFLSWRNREKTAELFAGARSAVVSASSVSVEMLASGTPVVALEWTSNQHPTASWLRSMGITVCRKAEHAARAYVQGMARLPSDHRIPDGKGCERVIEKMEALIC